MSEPQVISEVYSSEDWKDPAGAEKAQLARMNELKHQGFEVDWNITHDLEGDAYVHRYSHRAVKWPEPVRKRPEDQV